MKKSRILSMAMAITLAITSVMAVSAVAKKPALSAKKVSVSVGETKVVKVKNAAKNAKVKYSTSDKKIAKLGKKVTKGKKASVAIIGVAEGKAVVKAAYKAGKVKKNLKVNVTVTAAKDIAPAGATIAPSAAPVSSATVAPTAAATKTPGVTSTPRPTRTPRPTAGPTATPTPKPKLVNPYKVDLSTAGMAYGENGGSVSYNPATKSLESTMGSQQGFIIKNPITKDINKYSYVEVVYNLEGGDVNLYLADSSMEGNGSGQDAQGWHAEIKINDNGFNKDVTVTYGDDGTFIGGYIKALKIFNFGSETKITVKSITYYQVEK